MKNLKDIIQEKLVITKDTKLVNSFLHSANYVCRSKKELMNINNSVFTDQICSFLRGFTLSHTLYIWNYMSDEESINDLDTNVQNYAKQNNVQINELESHSFSDKNNSIFVWTSPTNKNYIESYIVNKTKTGKKWYLILIDVKENL